MPSLTIQLLAWAAGLVLIIALGVFIHGRSEKRAFARETARMTRLVERAESGDTKVQLEISRNEIYWPVLLNGNAELKQRYGVQGEAGRQVSHARDVAKEAYEFAGQAQLDIWWNESVRPEVRLEALVEYFDLVRKLSYVENKRRFLTVALGSSVESEANEWPNLEERKLFNAMYNQARLSFFEQLVKTAQTTLTDFRSLQRVMTYPSRISFNGEELIIPSPFRWNDWALGHIEKPVFADFVGQQNYVDLPAGTISLRVATAIREQNALELAITLSYCHKWRDCRKEVGDVLYADATKMYEKLRKQMDRQTV